jgi:hypothetical protein
MDNFLFVLWGLGLLLTTYLLYKVYQLYLFHSSRDTFEPVLLESVKPLEHPTKRIPYILHMTYFDLKKIPQKVYDNLNTFAPGYKLKLYDDQSGEKFLEQHFSKAVRERFQQMPSGAHKADLLRYCLLYIYGGVYLDVKTILLKPLDNLFKDRETSYFVLTTPIDKIYNGILATYPRNSFYLELVENYMKVTIDTTTQNYWVFIQNFYKLLESKLKNGEKMKVGEQIQFPDFKAYFFQERCTQKPEDCQGKLDRYGYCCYIYDKDEQVFQTRYSDFPW